MLFYCQEVIICGEERLRDATEEYLVFWAEKKTKPLLEFAGECR